MKRILFCIEFIIMLQKDTLLANIDEMKIWGDYQIQH